MEDSDRQCAGDWIWVTMMALLAATVCLLVTMTTNLVAVLAYLADAFSHLCWLLHVYKLAQSVKQYAKVLTDPDARS